MELRFWEVRYARNEGSDSQASCKNLWITLVWKWEDDGDDATIAEFLDEETGEESFLGYEPVHGDDVYEWIDAFFGGAFLIDEEYGPIEKAVERISEWMSEVKIGDVLMQYRFHLSEGDQDEYDKVIAERTAEVAAV